MNNLKIKVVSILMVMSMVLVLFGCGNAGDKEEFVGTWKATEAKDGKLYTTDSVDDDIDENSYELYEITSDGIKLSEPEGVEDDLGIFPLVMTKAE